MSLFDEDMDLGSDLLDDVGMIGDSFTQPSTTEEDETKIEEVTASTLLDDMLDETIFDIVLDIVKIVRWKKENSVPTPKGVNLNPYNLSVKNKVHIYQGTNMSNSIEFKCDHCNRSVGSAKYTYHLERCMRRRKRKSTNYNESISDREDEDIEDRKNYVIPPPDIQKVNIADLEGTEEFTRGWDGNDDDDDDEDEDDDEEDDDDDETENVNTTALNLNNQALPILGDKEDIDTEIVEVEESNGDGFDIPDMDGATPFSTSPEGGRIQSPSDLGLEELRASLEDTSPDEFSMDLGEDGMLMDELRERDEIV